MKPFWEITPQEVQRCLQATTWHAGNTGYFRGGGWSTRFRTRGNMPVTMCRLNLVKGLGPVLQIAEGYTINCPTRCMTRQTAGPTRPGPPPGLCPM
jgi:L-fucose isomerase